MTHDIDHERCSELLGAYLDNRLDEDDRAFVAAHLETCEECRQEAAGLEALVAPARGLAPDERAALRRAVAADLGLSARTGTVVALPARGARWRTRIAAGLGVAATVALLAAGALYVGGTGTDSADEAAAGRGGSEELDDVTGPRPVFEAGPVAAALEAAPTEDSTGRAEGAEGTEGEAYETKDGGDGGGGDAVATRVAPPVLRRLGARGEPFASFASAYAAPVSAELQRGFLEELAAGAPADLAEQVRMCGEEVVAGNDRVLPAYGAHRRYRSEDVLVLGFVTASGAGAPLDGYLFLLWPEGSCEVPVTSFAGPIGP